jgi:hypothetical protein
MDWSWDDVGKPPLLLFCQVCAGVASGKRAASVMTERNGSCLTVNRPIFIH